jgi:hypothetical protein
MSWRSESSTFNLGTFRAIIFTETGEDEGQLACRTLSRFCDQYPALSTAHGCKIFRSTRVPRSSTSILKDFLHPALAVEDGPTRYSSDSKRLSQRCCLALASDQN